MIICLNRLCLKLALSCVVMLIGSQTSSGQSEDGKVAVLDVDKVLQRDAKLQGQLAKFDKRLTELDATAVEAELNDPETAPDLTVQRGDILREKANAYFNAYQSIQHTVSDIAKAHGIALVVQADLDTVDRDSLESVTNALNRHVIFHRRLDLTNMVVQQLEKNGGLSDDGVCEKCGQVIPDISRDSAEDVPNEVDHTDGPSDDTNSR